MRCRLWASDIDQRALHFLERRHHRAAVLVLHHADIGLGGLHAGADVGVEHRQVDARHEAESEGLEQVGQREAGRAAARRQADAGAAGPAGPGRRCCTRTARGTRRPPCPAAAPAAATAARPAPRGSLTRSCSRPRRHLEVAGGHADQRAQCILGHVARTAQLDQILGETVDFRLLLHHADLRQQAVGEHRLVGGEDLVIAATRCAAAERSAHRTGAA